MTDLASRHCIPCRGGVPPLSPEEQTQLLAELGNDWNVVAEHHLSKDFKFKNFRDALAYVNEVGALAEREDHHPDIALGWGRVRIDMWTHAIDGLTESDFIFAARAQALLTR